VSESPAQTSPPGEDEDSKIHGAEIVVRDVDRCFGDFWALRNVNLTIDPGSVSVIIGGSGAGKTTLLRLMIGLDKPTAGSILLEGRDITELSERKLNDLRRELGMVFQYSALLDSMTVYENVAFPLREHNTSC
jgi:phospholipid/cholesterol/gamma-HCH transport system ATP-binding protein